MPLLFGLDHRIFAVSSVVLTTGTAFYLGYRKGSKCQQKACAHCQHGADGGELSSAAKRYGKEAYETQKALGEYLALHYAIPDDILAYQQYGLSESLDFPKRCADLCIKYMKEAYGSEDLLPKRALDIGCAVGRSTFELTQVCEEVVGIDYSQAFVDACNALKSSGSMVYSMLVEGDLEKTMEAVVDPSLEREKARFEQGDACSLSPALGQFNCVLAANLVCRLHTPKDFLKRLSGLIVPGGILVLTAPYTFMTQFTPREKWIGGFKNKNGENFTGFDGLKQNLEKDFELLTNENMPFMIRETARKYQWVVANATVWRRK